MLTVGEHRWGVFGCWKREGKNTLAAFYYIFQQKSTRWQKRNTLRMCFSAAFCKVTLFSDFGSSMWNPTKGLFLLCEYIYMKSYTKVWAQNAVWLSHSMDCFDWSTILSNLVQKTLKLYLKHCVWGQFFWWEYPQLSPCLKVVSYNPPNEKVEGFKKVGLGQCLNIRVSNSLNHFPLISSLKVSLVQCPGNEYLVSGLM